MRRTNVKVTGRCRKMQTDPKVPASFTYFLTCFVVLIPESLSLRLSNPTAPNTHRNKLTHKLPNQREFIHNSDHRSCSVPCFSPSFDPLSANPPHTAQFIVSNELIPFNKQPLEDYHMSGIKFGCPTIPHISNRIKSDAAPPQQQGCFEKYFSSI